jgi:transcriptional regulator with XRE-family HTH domain
MTRPSRHTPPINGKVLARARLGKGLTQAQVAAQVKAAGRYMDDSRVSKLEGGNLPYPSPALRPVLARVYGLTEDEMTAPCGTCGGEWSAACMEHDRGARQPGTEAA